MGVILIKTDNEDRLHECSDFRILGAPVLMDFRKTFGETSTKLVFSYGHRHVYLIILSKMSVVNKMSEILKHTTAVCW